MKARARYVRAVGMTKGSHPRVFMNCWRDSGIRAYLWKAVLVPEQLRAEATQCSSNRAPSNSHGQAIMKRSDPVRSMLALYPRRSRVMSCLSALLLVLAAACSSGFDPEDYSDTWGEVVELHPSASHPILLQAFETEALTRFAVHDGVRIIRVEGENVIRVELEDIAVGDLLQVYHSGIMMESDPATSDAVRVVILDTIPRLISGVRP